MSSLCGPAKGATSQKLALFGTGSSKRPLVGLITVGALDQPPGHMGAVVDTVQVAAGSGGALAVLAGSVAVWLKTRQQHIKLILKRPDGYELTVDATLNHPEAAIAQFFSETARHQDQSGS